ncbi:hypothetical protein KIW84_035149 [Lathyrus oleraceus]|uniref:Uncharacterized protein n=1 Tax=Pisum sativum TaxID=3888 RepID=A0A9D5B6B6_PEA|nr:hypothetical protein KIW84_035149 [Pisum sativum]
MGFNEEEALMAVERLGPNSSLEELVDFISVAQLVKSKDALLPPEDKPQCNRHAKPRKRSLYESEVMGRKKKPKVFEKRTCEEDDEAQAIHLPNPMVGFGIPTDPNSIITHRRLSHRCQTTSFLQQDGPCNDDGALGVCSGSTQMAVPREEEEGGSGRRRKRE